LFPLPTLFPTPTKSFKYLSNVCNTNMDLEDNIKRILNSAEIVYNTKDYTSATILYFKTLFAILDLIILKKQGKTPKDHTERFRILQTSFPDLYEIIDKYFKIYRDTYTTSIEKEDCDKIRKNVKELIDKYKI